MTRKASPGLGIERLGQTTYLGFLSQHHVYPSKCPETGLAVSAEEEEEVVVEVRRAAAAVGTQPSHSIQEVRDNAVGEALREMANTSVVEGEEAQAEEVIEADADADAVVFRNLKSIGQSEHLNSLMLLKSN